MDFTYSLTNLRNCKKIIIWVIKEQNLHKFVLRLHSEMNIKVKLDLFPCLVRDRKSPPQRRIVANIFGKEVDLRWRKVCSTNSMFIIRSQKIYSRAFIRVIAQHFIAKGSNVNRNLHKVVYKKEN